MGALREKQTHWVTHPPIPPSIHPSIHPGTLGGEVGAKQKPWPSPESHLARVRPPAHNLP